MQSHGSLLESARNAMFQMKFVAGIVKKCSPFPSSYAEL